MTTMPPPSELREGRLPLLEQELSDFTYIVSHDLAASFRHIAGFSDLLARNIGDVPSPEQGVYIGLIRDAAEKCEAMLDQLRAYSRVLQAPFNPKPCDVVRLLDVVRLQLSLQVRESGAQFEIGPLEPVIADPELLTEALAHIVGNAIKFRRTGVIPCVQIAQSNDDAHWAITVRDNGIGIVGGQEEKLFGMFRHGHPAGAYPGAGAGLTIARRILRLHGGDVRFVEAQKGACVEISMPRAKLAETRDDK